MFKSCFVLLTLLAYSWAKPGHSVAAHIAAAPVGAPIPAAYTAPVAAAYTSPVAAAYTATYAAYSTPYAAAYAAPIAAAAYTAPFTAAFTAPLASTSHSHRVDIFNKYSVPAKLIAAPPTAGAYVASPYFAPAAPVKIVAPAVAAPARLIAPAAALY